MVLTSKGIFVIENKNHSGIIIFNSDSCIQILGQQQNKIIDPTIQNNYHINILSKILNTPINSFKSYIVMGYDTIINDRIKRKNINIINIQELVDTMMLDLYNSSDVYTHEEVDNIYLNLCMLNKN